MKPYLFLFLKEYCCSNIIDSFLYMHAYVHECVYARMYIHYCVPIHIYESIRVEMSLMVMNRSFDSTKV